ncbi:MAG: DNA primase, partial [Acidimicrobiales bacterium]
MGIVGEDVARVRAAADFVLVAGEHVALKRVGRNWQGLCPFHAEKSPSFSVNAEQGLYYCFGCQASGDVISFVRATKGLDFVGAVEWLASKHGIELRYDDVKVGRERQRRGVLVEAMARAVDFYHRRLLDGPDAAPARAYLRGRGYDRDVVEQFRLGWAPDEWDALSRSLELPADVLRDAGLGFVNRAQRQQDFFRARVMFPIFDAAGDPVAFGGRSLGGDEAKYKNSQDGPIYAKSRTLYGLNWAKAAAVEAGELVVCEGYTDVIACSLAGVPRAVGVCGTALGEGHVELIRKFASRVVLAYDADAAGQAAAERFYQWEEAHNLDVRVARLPAGADPADLARSEPDRLAEAVRGAEPFLAFRIDRALEGAPLTSPERRAKAAEAALRIIAEHPNPLVRNQYVARVSARCEIPEADLLRSLRGDGRRARAGPVAPP